MSSRAEDYQTAYICKSLDYITNLKDNTEQAALLFSLRKPIFASNLCVKGEIQRSVAVLSKTLGTKQARAQILSKGDIKFKEPTCDCFPHPATLFADLSQ